MKKPDIDMLIEKAANVRENAHAPYSGLKVGAALIDDCGTVHIGCNVENASFPEGVCAEGGAISAMIAAGGKSIAHICIVTEAKHMVMPCGGCLQKIKEFGRGNTPITVVGKSGEVQHYTLKDLMPLAIGSEVLEARK